MAGVLALELAAGDVEASVLGLERRVTPIYLGLALIRRPTVPIPQARLGMYGLRCVGHSNPLVVLEHSYGDVIHVKPVSRSEAK